MSEWFDAERHVERAHELYEARRWEEAERELRRALEIHPARAEWHFNLALTLDAAGRTREAIASYAQANELDPDNPQTVVALGLAHLRAGEASEAIVLLERAHELEPARPDIMVCLVDALGRTGDHERAEMMFYLAMQASGVDAAAAYGAIADSLMERGLAERAAWCLREAAQLDPRLPRVHARLASACALLGRKERARQLFLRELRNNPGDIDTLLDLGRLLIEMNRPAEAAEKLRRVLELESDHPDAHFMLGEIAREQRREDDALAAFRLVLRLDPGYASARRRAAWILLHKGETGEARKLLRRDLRDLQKRPVGYDPEDLYELANLLMDARLYSDAVDVLRRLTGDRPRDAEAFHQLSVALFEQGDRRRGVAACRRAIRLESDHIAAMHNIALAYAQDGEWLRAWGWAKKASALDPDDASLRRLRTKLRLVLGAARARRGLVHLKRVLLRRR